MLFIKVGTQAGTFDKIVLVIGMTVGFLFGGWSDLLTALLVLHLVDVVTGVLVGGKNREISSNRMNRGIKKKVGSWLALILAHVIDGVLFEGQPIAITSIAFMLIGNEGLSITENLGNLGVPIPNHITKYLEQIRAQGDSAEITIGNPPSPGVERITVEDEAGQIQELYRSTEE